MSLIDDIRRDREDGTPGPWEKCHDHPDPDTARSLAHIRGPMGKWGDRDDVGSVYGCNGAYDGNMINEHNARRIARVPDMEAALLAAEELAAVAAEFERRCRIGEVRSKKSRADFAAALAAYRAAVEGKA